VFDADDDDDDVAGCTVYKSIVRDAFRWTCACRTTEWYFFSFLSYSCL